MPDSQESTQMSKIVTIGVGADIAPSQDETVADHLIHRTDNGADYSFNGIAALERINEGFDLMKSGESIRSVVLF